MHIQPFVQIREKYLVPFGLGIVIFTLYVSFLSYAYEANGIIEADYIENYYWTNLFNVNHMLYRPIMWLVYRTAIIFGYSGQALPIMQWISAWLGAVGIVLFYLSLRRLTNDITVSLLTAAIYAVTRQYWYWSTDINYDILSVIFIFGTVYLLTDNKRRLQRSQAVKLAILSGLAILNAQNNIFLIPVMALTFLVDKTLSWSARLRQLIVYGFSLSILLIIVYLLVGFLVKEFTTLEQLLKWLMGWEAGGGADAPTLGSFTWSRVGQGIQSYITSQVPSWAGIGLRSLILSGGFDPIRMLSGLATLLVPIIVTSTIVWLLIAWPHLSNRRRVEVALSLLFFGLFAVFGIWWESTNPRWFFISSAGLWITLALLLADKHSKSLSLVRQSNLVYIGISVFLIIGLANFTTTIAVNHFSPNIGLQKAMFVGRQMHSNDLLVEVHYGWGTYVSYFTHHKLLSLPLMASVPNRQAVLADLQSKIEEYRHAGHNVYIADDPSSRYFNYWEDVKFNTGLEERDIRALMTGPIVATHKGFNLTLREIVSPNDVGLLSYFNNKSFFTTNGLDKSCKSYLSFEPMPSATWAVIPSKCSKPKPR